MLYSFFFSFLFIFYSLSSCFLFFIRKDTIKLNSGNTTVGFDSQTSTPKLKSLVFFIFLFFLKKKLHLNQCSLYLLLPKN
ncbi:hypothetical protein BY996DRAFT_7147566 [Phakopsora pachyrhizi]|nr:hypothetical protein BY996DRAFT_7147566 [Phakopsora pachyrhizi]